MPVREAVTVRSYCRICTAQCGILVDVEDQQVVRVRGDKAHPVTHGYTCPKGRALGQLHHHPQRLERPLMKVDGILQPTSWGRCLDDLGAKLREVIDQHGPAAVGMFFGSGVGMDAAGYRTAEALQAAIGTPAKFSPLTIDGTAKTLVGSLVGGFPGFSARPDYERVRLVVYIGINPIVSHGHTVAMPDPARIVRRLAKNGEVWVIDPRFTETAKYASRHVAPKPGMDYAILAYLLRESLSAGANPDNTVDGDVLRKVVEPFDRARAAEIAGVSERDLADLLNAVRKAGRLAVETGTGVTMSAGANLTQWLGWALMIITDSMNRPGGVWFHPGFVRRLDAAPLPLITAPFGAGPSSRPELRGMVGDWPCAALPDEINAGHIRAFLNLGGAMMRSFPDSNRLGQALQRLEVFATLDIIEPENTRLSTHVLPTKDQLERPDVTLWDFLSPRVNAQYTPAAIEPVGERRSTWWVLAELMQRLGHTPPFPIPDDDRAHGADDAVLANFLASGRCSFVELANTGYHEVEHEIPARWVDAHIERLGGWRLAPAELVDQLTQLTQQAVQERSGSLMLVPRRQKRHLNAALLFLGDRPEVFLNPADAASIGVEDGQQCRVSTNRGELVGVVRIDTGMRVGVVSVPHGHEHANINWLTDVQAVDTITGMARYSGFPVSVHPVGARAPAPAEHT
jgi:anaerobic selenocysteine-containing dehydrogenase